MVSTEDMAVQNETKRDFCYALFLLDIASHLCILLMERKGKLMNSKA